MSYADYEPNVRSSIWDESVVVRSTAPTDADALAVVMAARGGAVDDYAELARRLIERLVVLLIAEKDGRAVGWSGIHKRSIQPDAELEWLVAGLTVVPEARRQGIAARLLREVLRATAESAPGEPVFSVVNARNLASIDLHKGTGFVELARSANFAGVEFTGGEGVLLRHP